MQSGELATVRLSRQLEKLRDFAEVEDRPLPAGFRGELRPYQKAGYNWLRFVQDYQFGGCLADDMGLGKSVQTLVMLQQRAESGAAQGAATLLVLPTSLVYNWFQEAQKFTPGLRLLAYTGTYRDKDIARFADYDVVLTSYGIVRLDTDLLASYAFDYVILDESQAIKNPSSTTSQAVRQLRARHRLILTGTPVENSTMDLWSQMSFINPGLLGTQAFFRKEFLKPIEKNQDEGRTRRLHALIKPFILRRHKAQGAQDLPAKTEQLSYCPMTEEQAHRYEETKSFYRNQILSSFDAAAGASGVAGQPAGAGPAGGANGAAVPNTQLLLLQGLTRLRQMANHPRLLDPWWNPAVEAQAVDRAHRIGQQRPVFTYKFITQDSVEEKILALQRRKLALVSELIATDEAVMKHLTREDIEELLG